MVPECDTAVSQISQQVKIPDKSFHQGMCCIAGIISRFALRPCLRITLHFKQIFSYLLKELKQKSVVCNT